jgi:hypothetical protein
MPFYGVQKPAREKTFKEAIRLARHVGAHVTLAEVPAYERMIRQGAWWDEHSDLSRREAARHL